MLSRDTFDSEIMVPGKVFTVKGFQFVGYIEEHLRIDFFEKDFKKILKYIDYKELLNTVIERIPVYEVQIEKSKKRLQAYNGAICFNKLISQAEKEVKQFEDKLIQFNELKNFLENYNSIDDRNKFFFLLKFSVLRFR